MNYRRLCGYLMGICVYIKFNFLKQVLSWLGLFILNKKKLFFVVLRNKKKKKYEFIVG